MQNSQIEDVKAKVTDMTEKVSDVSAKIPPSAFLAMALGSVAISASVAALTGRKSLANFFGLWAPTLMMIGVFSQMKRLEANTVADTLH